MSQKNGTKRRMKQTLVKCIIYQQGIFKCCTKKLNKKIEKVFMENWLVELFKQEVMIYKVEQLVHNPKRWKISFFSSIISKCFEFFPFHC
jgi:hypothetical protein